MFIINFCHNMFRTSLYPSSVSITRKEFHSIQFNNHAKVYQVPKWETFAGVLGSCDRVS